MQPSEEFTGLGMPVFTAFGWAGEETAQNYAYSQLEQFIALLHANMVPSLRAVLPHFGLSAEDQSVYLAAVDNAPEDVFVAFNARPVSLEIQLALVDKGALDRALKQIAKEPRVFQALLGRLEPEWSLRVQQVQVDAETGDQGHYQDIFKGSVRELNEENVAEIFEKAAYLNGDEQWVTPIYLSYRLPADQAAAMQSSIVPVLAERLEPLALITAVLLGQTAKKRVPAMAAAESEDTPKPEPVVPPQVLEQPEKPLSKDEFTFASELKPLHIDRGFINMTPEYWPFFAINARTESRPVIVVAGDIRDKDSQVWRLQPNDLARLVLGPDAQRWLEDNFVPGDYIQLVTTRLDDAEIEIVLEPLS